MRIHLFLDNFATVCSYIFCLAFFSVSFFMSTLTRQPFFLGLFFLRLYFNRFFLKRKILPLIMGAMYPHFFFVFKFNNVSFTFLTIQLQPSAPHGALFIWNISKQALELKKLFKYVYL